MTEQYTDDPSSPKEALVALLSSDFTPSETQDVMDDPGAGVLARFVAASRAKKAVSQRFGSEECAALGNQTARILESSPITPSFKSFIISYVLRAYAFESSVAEVASPSRLGLLSGEGIFDAEKAKDIEAQTLRGFLFDIVNTQIFIAESEPALETTPLIPNPVAYKALMDNFDAWALDYLTAYGEDAFAGVDPEIHMAAATRVRVVSAEEIKEKGWNNVIERLRRLRGGEEKQ